MTAVTVDAWARHAACRGYGTHVFSPPATESQPERRERETRAKLVCAQCPVRPQCLEYALRVREPLGIWGGLNEPERRQLLDRT